RLDDVRFRVLRGLERLQEEAPLEERVGRRGLEEENGKVALRLVGRDPDGARRVVLGAPLRAEARGHADVAFERLVGELPGLDLQPLDRNVAGRGEALERDA